MRWLLGFVVVLALAFGALWVAAGRSAPPQLTIDKPDRVVGQTGSLEITAQAPHARFTVLTVTLEQNGTSTPLVVLDSSLNSAPNGSSGGSGGGSAGGSAGGTAATVTIVDRDRVRITRPIGKQSVPELRAGPARVVVTATRPSFLNLRTLTSTASRDFQVRLDPPRIAVVSTHHYVNHGGSEMVVYRATPPDIASGVRVGEIEYPGFPAAGASVTGAGVTGGSLPGAGLTGADPALKVAFFALLHDQDLNSRILAFARDESGNEATATFVDNVFEKPFKQSRIELDDKFLNRVVPEISEHAKEITVSTADVVPAFLKINGELRRINTSEIAALAKETSPTKLWDGPFAQLGNSQVEASFADHRTYLYKGAEVDRQVHLGFDLAVTANVPIAAAAAGKVLQASWLGIYGNCIVIDHGLGVQSLYGHLSSFDVKVGDVVARGQTIGRSGMTGLAGGDHLHFTMLVGGHMVNPVEWWDPHWMADRVDRKLKEAR